MSKDNLSLLLADCRQALFDAIKQDDGASNATRFEIGRAVGLMGRMLGNEASLARPQGGGDIEPIAQSWLDAKFGSDMVAVEDRDYSPDEMIDAFMAGYTAALRTPPADEEVLTVPRYPTDTMMQAGLYHCSADMQWGDLFTAWTAMFDAIAEDGGCTASLPAAPPTDDPFGKDSPANRDCLAKARPGEPMFIILGRDPDGATIVTLWADRRAAAGDPDHAAGVYALADAMREYAADPKNAPESAPDAAAYPPADDRGDALRDAAQAVIDNRFSTYKARNGREVGIQADDGEKVWLVHSDYIFALETALATREGE